MTQTEVEVDAWTALESPFTVTEWRQLLRLKLKIAAVEYLAHEEQIEAEEEDREERPVSYQNAKALVFEKWRFDSGQMNELLS